MKAIKTQGPLVQRWNQAINMGRGKGGEAQMQLALQTVAKLVSSGMRRAEADTNRQGQDEKRQEVDQSALPGMRKQALQKLASGAYQRLGSQLRSAGRG